MPTDSTDGEDDPLDRWADAEQPFGDPEESSLVPEAPSVASYEEPDAEGLQRDLSDVDPELLNTFVVSVVLANVGVLLVSVGVLLAVFRDMTQIGLGLAAVGVVAIVRLRQHYQSYKRKREATASGDSQDTDESDERADGNESTTEDNGEESTTKDDADEQGDSTDPGRNP
ncbi:MAG: DUF7322 domain-containing protein [Halohasta sp.]